MIAFAVKTFERIRARFILLSFWSRGIYFVVSFAASSKMTMTNSLVRPIAFNTFNPLGTTYPGHVTPFPAILALQDSWVHICSPYHNNKASHIKASVDDIFYIGTILCVPYVDPYYSYVQFWQNLYDSWFGCKNDTIENVIILENFLNLVR